MPSVAPQPTQRFLKYSERVLFALVLIATVTVPIIIDKGLVNAFVMPKQYWFAAIVLVALVVLVAQTIFSKKIVVWYSLIDWAVLAFALAAILSACFSVAPYDSFFGRSDYFTLSAAFVILLAPFYFLVVRTLTSARRWRLVLDVLIAVGGVSAVLFLLGVIPAAAPLRGFIPILGNTVDQSSAVFGLWLIIIFMLSAGTLLRRGLSAPRTIFYAAAAGLAVACLTIMNLKIIWWLFFGALSLLLILGVSYVRNARSWVISLLFALLVATVIFIVFGVPRALQTSLPSEIILKPRASWLITRSTAFAGVKNFAFGSGLGTFALDFSYFRPADFNKDATGWYLRFNQPFGSLMGLLAEGGFLSVAVFCFIIFLPIGYLFVLWRTRREPGRTAKTAVKNKNEIPSAVESAVEFDPDRFDLFMVGFAWLLITLGASVVFFGPSLWFVWWLLLGIMASGLFLLNRDFGSAVEITLSNKPEYNLAFSFGIIVAVGLVVLGSVQGARWYTGERAYAAAVSATGGTVAEAHLTDAISRQSHNELFYAALAQVYLNRAVETSKGASPNVAAVSNLLVAAVNAARQGADIAPRSTVMFVALATMYENAATLLPDAREWAIKSLISARELEPSNPVLAWRLGNNYAARGDFDKAKETYESARALKADYPEAYLALAALYEQKKQPDEALKIYGEGARASGGNVDILFNWGRLLYNRNKGADRADAEILWLHVTTIEPNYSNAWYSLGLAAENRGDSANAIRYYGRVNELNPGNADIDKKINALSGKKNSTKE